MAKAFATGINQMNTMLLCEFWHGASLNFIVWGCAWRGAGVSQSMADADKAIQNVFSQQLYHKRHQHHYYVSFCLLLLDLF